jgi:hypothetical protein
VPVKHIASRAIHPAAQSQRFRRSRSAQIEIPVLQSRFLADVHVLVDLERQRGGFVEHHDARGDYLDLAGGNARIDIAFNSPAHLARHRDTPLVTQVVRDLVVADDDLHDSRGVPQIDERHTTVIPATGHPTGERHSVASVRRAQCAGLVRTDH